MVGKCGIFLSVNSVEQWCPVSSLHSCEMGISSKAGCWHAGVLRKILLAFSFPAESDKDEATAEGGELGLTVVPKQVTSALSSLSANYGGASDSEPEGA